MGTRVSVVVVCMVKGHLKFTCVPRSFSRTVMSVDHGEPPQRHAQRTWGSQYWHHAKW